MIAAIVDPRNCGLERAEVLFYAHTQFQRVFALTVECWWTWRIVIVTAVSETRVIAVVMSSYVLSCILAYLLATRDSTYTGQKLIQCQMSCSILIRN